MRNLGSWGPGEYKQTNPPTIPIGLQFPKGNYPEGEITEYKDENRKRITGPEFRAQERLFNTDYEALRKAAECHRQVRRYAQSVIKPGRRLVDIC